MLDVRCLIVPTAAQLLLCFKEILCLVFVGSPYVVKYYGSYFKNTDLWIVMEYCGAGSVSDIIRLRNKTVRGVTRTCVHSHSHIISLKYDGVYMLNWHFLSAGS